MRLHVSRQTAAAIGSLVVLIMVAGFMGFVAGYYEGTGIWPSFQQGEPALPPIDVPAMTSTEIAGAVAEIPMPEYGEGYNCVDFAWAAMRHLQWQGQIAGIVRLDLDPDPDHAVLLVATDDDGWVFMEPQTGQQIKPHVGGKWASGQTITGIYVMAIDWVPLDEYVAGEWQDPPGAVGGIADEVPWPGEEDEEEVVDVSDLREVLLAYGAVAILQVPLILAMMFMALWKQGWLRAVLSLCIVIWGAYYMTYDIKMAAPLIAVGAMLFFMSVFQLTGRGIRDNG